MFAPRLLPLLLVLVFLGHPSALPAADPAASGLEERHLPFSASVTRDTQALGSGEAVAAGTPFVLIRLEGAVVVADVSRRGVFRLALEHTDVAELARAAAARIPSAAEGLALSRMAMFIGNKLVGEDPDWMTNVPLARGRDFSTWILLYADTRHPAETDAAVVAAQTFYSGLDADTRSRVALVFVEVNGSAEGIAAVAARNRPGFQALPGYLSAGYTRAFAHFEAGESPPLWVKVNQAGTVLARHVGAGDVPEAFWSLDPVRR
jgi:hypothetical protein